MNFRNFTVRKRKLEGKAEGATAENNAADVTSVPENPAEAAAPEAAPAEAGKAAESAVQEATEAVPAEAGKAEENPAPEAQAAETAAAPEEAGKPEKPAEGSAEKKAKPKRKLQMPQIGRFGKKSEKKDKNGDKKAKEKKPKEKKEREPFHMPKLRGSLRTSLKRKWTAFMMLLVLSVLAIVSVFLLSATVNYYINQFRSEVGSVMTTDLLQELNSEAAGDAATAAGAVSDTMDAYVGTLGIGSGREYYILDGTTGECLATSEAAFDGTVPTTANIVTAMGGEVGESIPFFGKTMDIAVPVTGDVKLVISIVDNRSDMYHMCWLMFLVIMAALILGLAASAALSMVLIRTVTDPIEELRRGASGIAKGEYDQILMVQDPDEIGELTTAFNDMAASLRRSDNRAELERVRTMAFSGYLREGIMLIAPNGAIEEMNAAAEQLLDLPFEAGLTFARAFPNLAFPDVDKGITQLIMLRGGKKLRLVFILDAARGFTALLIPMEEQE